MRPSSPVDGDARETPRRSLRRSLLVRPVVLTRVPHRLRATVGQNPLANRGDATGGPANGPNRACGQPVDDAAPGWGPRGDERCIELWTALCTARPGNRPGRLQGAPLPSTPCGPEKLRPLSTMWTCVADIRTVAEPGDAPAGPAAGSRTGRSSGSPSPPSAPWSPSRCSCSPTRPSSGHLGTPQLAGLGVAGALLATSVSVCVFLAYGTTAAGRPPGRRRRPAGRDRPGDRRRLAGPGHRRAAGGSRSPSPAARWSQPSARRQTRRRTPSPTCGSRSSACPRCSWCSRRPACCAVCRTPAPRWSWPPSARWPTSCSTSSSSTALDMGIAGSALGHRARAGRHGGRVRGRRRARRPPRGRAAAARPARHPGRRPQRASRWSCAP